ncbi:chymotrypsin-like elastase family member 2A [Clavelina lepadiformis]|uniref:chymotrypsin-like elastase family member 2A n=1 Tax=Clavelina lepadiformis TaxID=159417 RepID=UPI004042CEA3
MEFIALVFRKETKLLGSSLNQTMIFFLWFTGFALVASLSIDENTAGWTKWSTWSSCQTSCGNGMRFRSRACKVNRESQVMTYCRGRRISHQRCELPPCPTEASHTRSSADRTSSNDSQRTDIRGSQIPVTTAPEVTFMTTQGMPVCPWLPDSNTTSCGEDKSPMRVKKIVGGKKAKPNVWPWQVAIWSRKDLVCGGTVISRGWVLTAAHCFLNLTTYEFVFDNMELRFGSHSRNDIDDGVIVTPLLKRRVFIHPRYDAMRKTYDVAMIQLDPVLLYNDVVAPACLPEFLPLSIRTGDFCYVVGWGDTMGHGPSNIVLKQLRVEVVANNVCKFAYFYPLTQMILCAGGVRNEDTCSGDSGGPLLCKSRDTQKWEIQGVISFGSSVCGKANAPTLFMQVSYFLPWIELIMHDACLRWLVGV